MSSDPPASDLGAIRMRLNVLQAIRPGYRLTVCDQMDIARLLTAYAAQAARLADLTAAYDRDCRRLAHRNCDRCAADACDACTGTTDGTRPCYCPHRGADLAARLAAVMPIADAVEKLLAVPDNDLRGLGHQLAVIRMVFSHYEAAVEAAAVGTGEVRDDS